MTDEPLIRWEWVTRNAPELLARAGEHLVMTSIAISVGFAVSLAPALFVRRRRRLRSAVFAVGNVAYAIPSLALFALLIPLTGLTLLTAEIALVSYTVLILVDLRRRALRLGFGQGCRSRAGPRGTCARFQLRVPPILRLRLALELSAPPPAKLARRPGSRRRAPCDRQVSSKSLGATIGLGQFTTKPMPPVSGVP